MDLVRHVSLIKDRRVIASAAVGLVAGFLIAALIFGKPWHLAPNWGDIPTWLAVAVATAGGWVALYQLRSQQDQLRSQQEVLKRDGRDRRRAQAARIFIGVPSERDRGDSVIPNVKNASDFPIYEAEFWYLDPYGQLPSGSKATYRGTILPGHEAAGTRPFRSDEGLRRTVLTFRDANNVYWIRMPGGVLEEQPARATPDSVRATVRMLPPELGPEGMAVLRGLSQDAPGADDND